MGDRAHVHGAVCYSEKAVTDTYYETLYPIIKGEEEYANVMPFTDKLAEVSKKENKQLDKDDMSPKAIFEDATIRRLKILCIVLVIMIIISTVTISAFIHVLMQRADATDHRLVQVQRTTQLEQDRTEDQTLVQTMNASIIQLKLDQRYDRVMIQLLKSSYSDLQMKTQDLNSRLLLLHAQVAEKNTTNKTQETKFFELELDSKVLNNSLKFLDTRLETIEAQQQAMNKSIVQFDLDHQNDQAMIESLNSSNTDLLKKNHEMNTRILRLDARLDEINVTKKTQETRLFELQLDSNHTRYSLQFLNTSLETIKAQQVAMNKSIIRFDLDHKYDQGMIQSLNSSNTDLQKKNHEMNIRIALLDAQIAEFNVTDKAQETKLSELERDFNDTRYSLKSLDTRLETIKAQQQAMNKSVMQFDLDQQYDQAMIERLNSSNTDLLKRNRQMNTRISLLDAQLAEINVTYKAQETKFSELQRVSNDTLKSLDNRLETIEGGPNCSCENWAPFTACSVSIGIGIHFRMRKCKNTSTFLNRMWCSRNETETEPCGEASDCQDILKLGFPSSGVYKIRPSGTTELIRVYCEMDSAGKGWTVIQKRYNGSVDFYRSWIEYKEGFGKRDGEYWIGNEVLHKMTKHGSYTLKIILTDWNDTTKFAVYNTFIVSGEDDKYLLKIGGYSGYPGNAMANHNNRKFSTFDNDNDGYSVNCAEKYHGAWWYYYYYCYYAHLNGRYYPGPTVPTYQGIIWYTWHGYSYSLKATQMMIRKI